MKSIAATSNNCQECGDVLKGRSDKKFCNDYCRSSYNNRLKNGQYKIVRNINNAIARNRKILETLLNGKAVKKVSPEDLLQLGFQFKYITQLYKTGVGKTYYFCYDYGYMKLDNGSFLVVRKKDI